MEGPCLGEAQPVLRGEPQRQRLGAQYRPPRVTAWRGPWSDRHGDAAGRLARLALWVRPRRAGARVWRGDWQAGARGERRGGAGLAGGAGAGWPQRRTPRVRGTVVCPEGQRRDAGRWPRGRKERTGGAA